MAQQFLPVLITLGVTATFAALVLAVAAVFAQRARHHTPAKRQPYETGIAVSGPSGRRLPIRFAIVALVFVVLDVEVAFLYPWAVVYGEGLTAGGWILLFDMLAFIFLLAIVYAWLWKTGVFDWGRTAVARRSAGARQ